MEINRLIHTERQRVGAISGSDQRQTILTPRQDLTGADRQWAARYGVGDLIRYSKGSRAVGVASGEYARVTAIDRDQNLVTVERSNGSGITYDPRRLQGVSVFREDERQFSAGDRIQFTAPYKNERVANRQLGTIEKLDASGRLRIRLDSGRDVEFKYRSTSTYRLRVCRHQPQRARRYRGPRANHVDSASTHETLINKRLGYVAVSRARYDVKIYTNDARNLGLYLSRDTAKCVALSGVHEPSALVPEMRGTETQMRERTWTRRSLAPAEWGWPDSQRAMP
jgi:hypothetical protein